MKSAAAILFCICLLPGGCSKQAVVRIETGPNAEISVIRIESSSGDSKADEIAIRATRDAFPKKVPNPRRNHTYVQPVDVEDCYLLNWPF